MLKKGYEHFTVEDFAADHDFVRWVRMPDSPGDRFWRQWLAQHPHKQADVDKARFLVRSVLFRLPEYAGEAREDVWQRIMLTNQSHKRQARVGRGYSMSLFRGPGLRVAAVVTGLLTVVTFALFMLRQRPAVYATNFGETQTIRLPDGSTVVLNANSALRLGSAWTSDREVWLDGEAFFSVRKRQASDTKSRPLRFTVHTNTLDVNVLGTEFTVSDRRRTKVVLSSGSIALTMPGDHSGKTIIMEPGEMVEVMPGKRELVQTKVNPDVYSAWKDHVWILDGLSLEQVSQRITDTYGLQVVIRNPADAGMEVSGVVPTGNPDAVLKALSAVFERRFIRNKNTVQIE